MKSRIAFVLAICAAGMVGTAVAGTTYWKDKDGKITDTPAAGAEKVMVKTPGQGSGSGEPTDGQAPAVGAAAPTQGPASPEEQAAVRADQCQQARKHLDEYKHSSAIYEEDGKGGRKEITGNDRVELIVNAQRNVKDMCGEVQAAQ